MKLAIQATEVSIVELAKLKEQFGGAVEIVKCDTAKETFEINLNLHKRFGDLAVIDYITALQMSLKELQDTESLDISTFISQNIAYQFLHEIGGLRQTDRNLLEEAGFRFIGDLISKSEAEMLAVKRVGKRMLARIKSALNSRNLDFGTELPGFPDAKILERINQHMGKK